MAKYFKVLALGFMISTCAAASPTKTSTTNSDHCIVDTSSDQCVVKFNYTITEFVHVDSYFIVIYNNVFVSSGKISLSNNPKAVLADKFVVDPPHKRYRIPGPIPLPDNNSIVNKKLFLRHCSLKFC